jgi:hypothetical protein
MEETDVGDRATASGFWLKMNRRAGFVMAGVFGVVGLLFLLIPQRVIDFFNRISPGLGFIKTQDSGTGFYLVLAVGYMVLVTLLALLMARHPGNPHFPLLLITGKASSSILSFAMFFVHGPYLIYLANGIVDGTIALCVFVLFGKMRTKAG